MSGLRFPENVRPARDPALYRVLALCGGGYRGLFVAEVLRRLEIALGRPIAGTFALKCGTSIGGILAIGLAVGQSAEVMAAAIRAHGPRIFDPRIRLFGRTTPLKKPRGSMGGLLSSKYSNVVLSEAIKAILGSEKAKLKVKDVSDPFLVVTTCATTQSPFIISNLEPLDTACSEVTLMDALLATAAAPPYFPAWDVGDRSLVDGGLVANAPELVAVSQLMRRKRVSFDTLRILSIGTAGPVDGRYRTRIGNRGLLSWAKDIVPLTLSAQERLTVDIARSILGDERYRRLDAVPNPVQAAILALDRTDAQSTAVLSLLAEDTANTIEVGKFQAWLGLQSMIA